MVNICIQHTVLISPICWMPMTTDQHLYIYFMSFDIGMEHIRAISAERRLHILTITLFFQFFTILTQWAGRLIVNYIFEVIRRL